jgi:hypothetical protein
MECNELDHESSLLTFLPSAIMTSALDHEENDYDLVTILALAQRLHVNILPLTWQAALGSLGQGGQSIVNQALVIMGSSLAFKRFKPPRSGFPILRDAGREMVMLAHPAIRNHPFVVRLEGICWDIRSVFEIWPVLVFQKSPLGNLHEFMITGKGQDLAISDRLALCSSIAIALKDMASAGKLSPEFSLQHCDLQYARNHSWRYQAPKRTCFRKQ